MSDRRLTSVFIAVAVMAVIPAALITAQTAAPASAKQTQTAKAPAAKASPAAKAWTPTKTP